MDFQDKNYMTQRRWRFVDMKCTSPTQNKNPQHFHEKFSKLSLLPHRRRKQLIFLFFPGWKRHVNWNFACKISHFSPTHWIPSITAAIFPWKRLQGDVTRILSLIGHKAHLPRNPKFARKRLPVSKRFVYIFTYDWGQRGGDYACKLLLRKNKTKDAVNALLFLILDNFLFCFFGKLVYFTYRSLFW